MKEIEVYVKLEKSTGQDIVGQMKGIFDEGDRGLCWTRRIIQVRTVWDK